ncbi:MAG: hypothetical protein PVJ01_00360 [Pseudomonadota bacterium]
MRNFCHFGNISRHCLPVITAFAVTLCVPQSGPAQGYRPPEKDFGLILSLAFTEQLETDLGESRFEASRRQFKAEKSLVKNRGIISKVNISHAVSDYLFSGPAADPWSDPWGQIKNTDAGLSLILAGSGNWSWFMAATLDWSWEKGADTGEGLVYGIILSRSYAKSSDRRIGLGVGVFEGLEETKIFPYPTVSWRLKENLTLQNPLSAGPAGPAGLELVFNASENWELGTGGAYRSFRFRLDKEGIAPEGIGEITGVPAWVRASWQASPKLEVGLYTGAILAGETTIEDSEGRKLQSRHFNPAPLAAFTLKLAL